MPDKNYGDKTTTVSESDLEKFVGVYQRPNTPATFTITKKNGSLYCDFYWRPGELELVPLSANSFAMKETAGVIDFNADGKGNVTGLVFHLGGDDMPGTKVKAK
jgi:hypothetical protein